MQLKLVKPQICLFLRLTDRDILNQGRICTDYLTKGKALIREPVSLNSAAKSQDSQGVNFAVGTFLFSSSCGKNSVKLNEWSDR